MNDMDSIENSSLRAAYSYGVIWLAQAKALSSLSEDDLKTVIMDCYSKIVSDPHILGKYTRGRGLAKAMCGFDRVIREKGYAIFEHPLIEAKLKAEMLKVGNDADLVDSYWNSAGMFSVEVCEFIHHKCIESTSDYSNRLKLLKNRKTARIINAVHE